MVSNNHDTSDIYCDGWGNMKLAIIFIGTGNYINFLPTYYEACEDLLVPNTKKLILYLLMEL